MAKTKQGNPGAGANTVTLGQQNTPWYKTTTFRYAMIFLILGLTVAALLTFVWPIMVLAIPHMTIAVLGLKVSFGFLMGLSTILQTAIISAIAASVTTLAIGVAEISLRLITWPFRWGYRNWQAHRAHKSMAKSSAKGMAKLSNKEDRSRSMTTAEEAEAKGLEAIAWLALNGSSDSTQTIDASVLTALLAEHSDAFQAVYVKAYQEHFSTTSDKPNPEALKFESTPERIANIVELIKVLKPTSDALLRVVDKAKGAMAAKLDEMLTSNPEQKDTSDLRVILCKAFASAHDEKVCEENRTLEDEGHRSLIEGISHDNPEIAKLCTELLEEKGIKPPAKTAAVATVTEEHITTPQ